MSNFDETMLKRLTKLEREVERLKVKESPAGGSGVTDHGLLTGLEDNDHPQYLLTTGKAADSDKLDGIDSTGFATSTHNHDTAYLGITGKAADSDKLDGKDSTDFSLATHNHDTAYLGITAKAANSDKLDGYDSTDFGRPVFLTAPLTSTAWDGDAFSTTEKTKIDLSEVFGVPAGIKAVLVWVAVRDSASQTTDCYFRLSPVSTGVAGIGVNCDYVNDRYGRHSLIVPCDANGDIYYQIAASGSGTMDVFLQIWGYWL